MSSSLLTSITTTSSTPNPTLVIEPFIVENHDLIRNIRITGQRYVLKTGRAGTDADAGANAAGIVLFLAHGAGLHKETWEPMLEDLQAIQLKYATRPGLRVVEAWAVDCPNHGESGKVNDVELRENPGLTTCVDFGRCFHAILKNGLVKNVKNKKIVLVGHSAGAVSSILATHLFQKTGHMPLSALVLVEMTSLQVPAGKNRDEMEIKGLRVEGMIEASRKKKDKWASRPDARAWMARRSPWKVWDQRALDSFVSHGLRDLPTAFYPESEPGVTLCCYKMHETDSYANFDDPIMAVHYLVNLTQLIPVHLVFGQTSLFRPSEEDLTLLKSSKVQRFASISDITGSGHLVPQEKPALLAQHLFKIIHTLSAPAVASSKL